MEIQKIRKIKNKTKLIEQLFGRLEKLKKHELEDMTPFKGGLPELPRVVGLICKLPDGVNNLISKFLGFERRLVKQIKFYMNRPLFFECLFEYSWWRAKNAPNELLHRVMEHKFPKLPKGTELNQASAFLDYAKGGPKNKIPELRRKFERFPNHIKYQILSSAWGRQCFKNFFPRENISAMREHLNNT